MKIAVITDTHFGFKRNSKCFHDYFELFYNNIFFPYLEKNNITTIIHMGDVFDSRKTIDYVSLEWSKKVVFDKLKKYDVHMIVGNHDVYYKNTNNINSPSLLLDSYSNISVYSEPVNLKFDDLEVSLIPWICSDNEQLVFDFIKNTRSRYCFGHLELKGFNIGSKIISEEGYSKKIFRKFEKVFSGHFHVRSNQDNIFYIGNPYEMFSNDSLDERGFIVFDTESLEHEYVNNPYNMFYTLYYHDNLELFELDFDFYQELEKLIENKIVKLVINSKVDLQKYDQFIERILNINLIDLKIIDNTQIKFNQDNREDIGSSNTLDLLHKFVDEIQSNDEVDKSRIKSILTDIYNQSFVDI